MSNIHSQAVLAVAKALNLYPSLDCEGVVPLVGRTHARIQVLWSRYEQGSYTAPNNKGDIFMVVTGESPDFDIRGFVYQSNLIRSNVTVGSVITEEWSIYHHVLTPVKDAQVFWELINGSRNWRTAYEKEGNKCKKKTAA